MNKYKNNYETSNLPLAATVLCFNISLVSIKKTVEGKYIFIFTQSSVVDSLTEKYWKKSLKVEPNSYWESIRFLKNIIHRNDYLVTKEHENDK